MAPNGRASGSYAGVNEQTGIQAGAGGFGINVKGNTDLKGAYIASTATPDKNQLTTGTLTWSDVQNHSDYSATSSGFSAGGSVGNGGSTYNKNGGKPTGGAMPMLMQHESSSESATTRSAIAQGAITITDQVHQKQDVGSLNCDTDNLNGKVGKAPDLQNVLNNQADMMAAAQAAGAVVARAIGDIADAKRAEALAAADQAHKDGNDDLAKQYAADADRWKEGGAYRAGLHMAGGALVAGLGGGSAIGGAVGAGAASLAAPRLTELADKASSSVGGGAAGQVVGNVVANVAAGAVGSVGGGSGAFMGANVDRYNRQLHPDERKWAKDNAKKFATFYKQQVGKTLTEDQAENMLLANGYRLVDEKASKGPGGDTAAVAFINGNAGGLFQKDANYSRPEVNGNADGSLTPEQRALPGAVANPKVGLGAAALVTGVVAAPGLVAEAAALIRACASNIVLCANQVGIHVGEVAAAEAMPAGTGAAVTATAAAAKATQEANAAHDAVSEAETLSNGATKAVAGKVAEQGNATSAQSAANSAAGAAAGSLEADTNSIARNGDRLVIDQRYVSNIGDVACGPTACAMVLNDRGQWVNITQLAKEASLVPGVGTDVVGLAKTLRNNGLGSASWKLNASVDDLAVATSNGNAAIARVTLENGSGHFVVVDGVTVRQGQSVVAVRDPGTGTQYFVPRREFADKFSGQVVFTH
ncbi:cysteine peptidase family C39 domain-containing protein [Ralstonia solanacearum]|uniref:cysteine peptidase family C39 domain-containing protein n=3 Tax=Ralstonia solanacearum TaxID=305 RepID=UPI0018D16EBC|nr:cysteine peptidase family C39 domain-containing protein [Ralstonia solanacearum]